MENKINLSMQVTPYVKYFQVAQMNLSKYMEEEVQPFKRIHENKRESLKRLGRTKQFV